MVMMGIGKTGIIAHKMAASFASTGTPSIFVNAAEAVHGDLGMINAKDVAILVSNSGSTNEILNIIDPLHRLGCTIIAMTGHMDSPLAQRADYALSIHVDTEACPLGLAPTTSTTALMRAMPNLRKPSTSACSSPKASLSPTSNGEPIKIKQ